MGLLCQEPPTNRVRAHLVKVVSVARAPLLFQDFLLTFRSPRLTVIGYVVRTFFDVLIGFCILVETFYELLSVKLVRVDVHFLIAMNVLPNLVIILVLVVVSTLHTILLKFCSSMAFADRTISKVMMQLLATSIPEQLARYQSNISSLGPVRCFLKPHVDHSLLLLKNTC